MVFPIWWVVNIVFSQPGVSVTVNPHLFPTSLTEGIKKFIKIFNETTILRSFFNSIAFVLLQILGVLILCSMAAFEFALFRFPGKRFLFFFALLALMVPTAVTLVPTYLLVADFGWLNSLKGLVIPGLASAFGLFVMTQFMEALPKELFEAGEMDGLNHFGLYWYIAMPLSKNAIITLAILQFIRAWGNYIWPLVIATKQESYTISQMVGMYNNVQTYSTIDIIMAVNFLAILPSLLFFFFLQRFIIEGVSMSGLKG
jgi:multiple sugar transport system permease protein